jgi:outer membrane protein assembly factor BamD
MLRLFIIFALMIPGPADGARKERKRLTVKEQYELGLKYMKRGRYIKAVEQFNRVRNYHRDDPHSVKAELAIGDVYFRKSEWDQARLAYDEFARMHPRHPDLDYVTFRIGMSSYQKAPKRVGRDQTFTRHAMNAWAGFGAKFPESEYSAEVEGLNNECRERMALKELWIARFYKRRSAWAAVERRAASMASRYPGSQHLNLSIALIGEASAWQGNDTAADMAIKRLETDAPEAAKRLAATIEKIRSKRETPAS